MAWLAARHHSTNSGAMDDLILCKLTSGESGDHWSVTEAGSPDTWSAPGAGDTLVTRWGRWSSGDQRPIRGVCAAREYLDWAIGSRISNNYSVPISHISILYDHYISIIVHLFALACSNSVKNDLGMFVLSPFRAALLDCLRAFTQPSLKTNPSSRFQLCLIYKMSFSKMQFLF